MDKRDATRKDKTLAIGFVALLLVLLAASIWLMARFGEVFLGGDARLPGMTVRLLLTYPWWSLFVLPSLVGAWFMWHGVRKPAWYLLLIPILAVLFLVPFVLWAVYSAV
jgi:hypothetical protein